MKYRQLICGLSALVLAFSLTGCGEPSPTAETTLPEFTQATEPPETQPAPTQAVELPQTTHHEMDSDRLTSLSAYLEVLDQLSRNGITPDGQQVSLDPGFGRMEENRFTIADVDGDGAEELVIWFTTAPTAGHCCWVCGYYDGEIQVEASVYPATEFYTGGLMTMGWSHNQGLAGDALWPYTIFGYNPATRTYEVIAHVDAWNRNFREFDYENKRFPAAIDTDNAGVVYLVTQNNETVTLSRTDYEAWRESLFGSAEPMELNISPMTTENITTVLDH